MADEHLLREVLASPLNDLRPSRPIGSIPGFPATLTVDVAGYAPANDGWATLAERPEEEDDE